MATIQVITLVKNLIEGIKSNILDETQQELIALHKQSIDEIGCLPSLAKDPAIANLQTKISEATELCSQQINFSYNAALSQINERKKVFRKHADKLSELREREENLQLEINSRLTSLEESHGEEQESILGLNNRFQELTKKWKKVSAKHLLEKF